MISSKHNLKKYSGPDKHCVLLLSIITRAHLDDTGTRYAYDITLCTSGFRHGGLTPAGGSAHARNGRGCRQIYAVQHI